ncbi:MAG: choline dehydrogenase [Rhodobacteraceae bacterium]|nr:choline dehydrogenase [Paracoccaceae bacterium]
MNFDYLIIGAGSAGCVLANRLTENNQNNVAIFEAGKPSDIWKVNMPLAILYTMHDPKYNYKYYSEPEPHLHNRRLFCPRGKMIGGCSAHNGMVFVRGNPNDYQRWASFGLDDWSYEKVLPYFKKIETWSEGENEYRGGGGILPVNQSKNKNPLFKAFVDSAGEAGYKINNDMNGKEQEGFGMYDVTIHNGERASVSKYYLNPAKKRKNLKVFTEAFVERIIFDGKKAIGIEVKIKNKVEKIYANKEVILSGGAINSPQLLMLSGIGPSQHLKDKGIDVVHNLEGVGKNLQDHLELYIQMASKKPVSLYKYWSPIGKAWVGLRWFISKSGPGASNQFESAAFIRSKAGVEYPDIQYHFLPLAVRYDGKLPVKGHGFQAHVGPMRSQSRGYVTLRSSDPKEPPKIQFNYMSHESDWIDFRNCIRLTREIFSQPAFEPFAKSEISPGKEIQSDDQLNDFIRDNVESAYHPCGTCKMGDKSDPMSVVDPETRVIGVDKLRVADSSIFPQITNGNLNAPSIMVGEKASDHILGKDLLPRSNEMPWIHPDWHTSQR